MSNMVGKVAYLRGLCDGIEIKPDTKESKVLLAIVDVLEEMAMEMTNLGEAHRELDEYVESIDDDLADMEEVLMGEGPFDRASLYDDEDDDDTIEFECPHCGNSVFFDAYVFDLEDEHACPHCGHSIAIEELEDDDDEDDDEEV